MIAWFAILCHIEEHVKSRVRAEVRQGYNNTDGVPDAETIRIYRSDERDVNLWVRKNGSVTFAVDVWHGNDDPDPRIANQALAELEEELQAALATWPDAAAKDLKMKITITIDGVTGDGENYRPMCAAFYRITVKWNK